MSISGKILVIQHVPFETPAYLLEWASKKGYGMEIYHIYKDTRPLDSKEGDLLIVMGGPMNIYEYEAYPWLKEEREIIKEVLIKDVKLSGSV